MTGAWASDHNAIVLSNLNPRSAASDPNYGSKAFVSLLNYLYRFETAIEGHGSLKGFLELLMERKIQLVIQTYDERIAKQAQALKDTTTQKIRVTGADLPTPEEIYARVVKSGIDGLKNTEQTLYRVQISAESLIYQVNESPELRQLFNEPTPLFEPLRFQLYREHLGVGRSF
jgi:hypothetical protein